MSNSPKTKTETSSSGGVGGGGTTTVARRPTSRRIPQNSSNRVRSSSVTTATYTTSQPPPPPQPSSSTTRTTRATATTKLPDFRDLANHCTTTYDALSYVLEKLLETITLSGRTNLYQVNDNEVDSILTLLENHQIDLSCLSDFPLAGAPNLDGCLILLAILQNRASEEGQQQQQQSSSNNNSFKFVEGGSGGPTIRDITEFTLLDRTHKQHRYDIVEWVEVRGNSMKYRMEIIDNIILKTKTNGEGEHEEKEWIYETTVDPKLSLNEIRWPREALRRIFGMGPWVWQQWAMLKLENKLVFKDGHHHDFEVLDIRGYANELWQLWIHDKRNTTFKTQLWDRVGISGQEELVHHIMSPFNLIVEVIHNEENKWDFTENDHAGGISMFTYNSLLGTGFLDGFLVFVLQASIPIILFFYYTSDREYEKVGYGTREMLFVVLIYYLYKVVRDTASDFHEMTGLASSTAARIQSLRTILFENGNDSIYQSLGYTADLFMNTGYICYLYIFNIWILFNVDDPFELLGSVIFFEFLQNLDEEIASSRWWDTRTKRYLKAGVVDVIIQNTIRKKQCQSSDIYLNKYNSPLYYNDTERQLLIQRLHDKGLIDNNNANNNSSTFLKKTTTASRDEEEESQLLTLTERVERLRRKESTRNGKEYHHKFYKPRPVRFSGAFHCRRGGGIFSFEAPIFERHEDLRAWSQWEEL